MAYYENDKLQRMARDFVRFFFLIFQELKVDFSAWLCEPNKLRFQKRAEIFSNK